MDVKVKPNISIIVPVYNVKKWLEKCLISIKKQSFSDFEVLLIDDGSTDGSDVVCKWFAKTDVRFKYFRKSNGGLSDARNYGIEKSIGDFLIFIDSDDYIHKDFVSRLHSEILRTQADIAICGFYREDSSGKIIDEINLWVTEDNLISGKEAIKLSFDDKKNGWALACAWNKIYRRELFANLRFEKGRYYEDGLIFPFLFLKLKRVAIIHIPLYYYVQRKNSIMHSKINIKKIMDDNYSMLRWIELFEKRDFDLYQMSIIKYKNWIINKYIATPKIIKNNSLNKYFQDQYRIYAKATSINNAKTLLKDVIGCFDINILCTLIRLKSHLKLKNRK